MSTIVTVDALVEMAMALRKAGVNAHAEILRPAMGGNEIATAIEDDVEWTLRVVPPPSPEYESEDLSSQTLARLRSFNFAEDDESWKEAAWGIEEA